MLMTGIMVAALAVSGAAPVQAQEEVRVYTGFIDGAQYRVEVPPDWNGTLVVYSHGVYPKGYLPEPLGLTNRPETKPELLDRGYALAASAYSKTYGFSAREAVRDQTALMDWFDRNVGVPKQIYSSGASAGGLNAILVAENNPHRVDGVLAMCGPLAGGEAMFTSLLDMRFTIRTLLAPELEVVRFTDPASNMAKAKQVIDAAVQTPEGRARLALASAYASIPGWTTVFQPRSTDTAEQIRQQTQYTQTLFLLAWGDLLADLEQHAGGVPTGNVGVDYGRLLAKTSERNLVVRAYRDAGLDLSADLAKLAAAPRIAADPAAVQWLKRYGTPTGRGRVPVAALHPIGDGVGPEFVRDAAVPVRELYLNRAGHCQHTAAEEITALGVVQERAQTGRWPSTSPNVLNAKASRYPVQFHTLFDWLHDQNGTSQPSFARYQPKPLPR
jgi:hypothetical protein